MQRRNTVLRFVGIWVISFGALLGTSPAQQAGPIKDPNLIGPQDLLPDIDAVLNRMGGRLMSSDRAKVVLTGNITDANGTRAAEITIQAPGLMSFREGQGRAITFDGTQLKGNAGALSATDLQVAESLLAHVPDSVCLQAARGGTWRRLGSRFRTDDGKDPNYAGPYWTVYAFSPSERPGLSHGVPLQQDLFIAIDEKTWLISEVRTIVQSNPKVKKVVQTQFGSWVQRAGQWYPGAVVRLEDGRQILSFTLQDAGLSAAGPASGFRP